jgi:Na+-translocating ferredoxin:NAD+ oxidoreductase RNF subunit RnfB
MDFPLISIDNEICKTCYACVRVCPVKAIIVEPNQEYPSVVSERCIGCGSCVQSCSPNAITYRESKLEVLDLIASDSKVAAIVDPSISGEFNDITDYRKFVKMIQALGFDYVAETSFGVDLVGKEYAELFSNFLGKFYITTCCPPIISLIEKYHPGLIENLAPIVNPMVATAKVIHKTHGNDVKVVFIGPCIGAKDEIKRFNDDGKVDAVLTFTELREMFDAAGIKENNLEYSEFDDPIGFRGSIYPISNGILQASNMDETILDGSVITTEGKTSILEAVKEFEESIDFIRKHFNLFYCEGCLMGPGTTAGGKKFIRKTLVIDYSNKRLKSFDHKRWQDHISSFSGIDLKRGFVNDDQRLPDPEKERVDEVLKIIGKSEGTSDLGCGSCGYETCNHFAEAVAKGLAKPDMCITYSLKSKQDYIKTLRVTNEKLAKTQHALQNSEKIARHEQIAAQDALETNVNMLKKLPMAIVVVDENLKIVRSNDSFVNILGEEAAEINDIIPGLIGADLKTLLPFQFYKLFSYVLTSNEDVIGRDVHYGDRLLNVSVFPVKKDKFVGGVIRDMYLPEVRKEEVITRVSDVIEQNLELVQKIAFLLGEGAATTEKMLNSIIESHKASGK